MRPPRFARMFACDEEDDGDDEQVEDRDLEKEDALVRTYWLGVEVATV